MEFPRQEYWSVLEKGKATHSSSLMPQLVMRPSSIAPNPVEFREAPPNSTVTLTSQRHAEKRPEVTGTSRWNPGFPAATQEPGVGDGQGGLACCGSWGLKESDTTELN